jgi:hypothetical protein
MKILSARYSVIPADAGIQSLLTILNFQRIRERTNFSGEGTKEAFKML